MRRIQVILASVIIGCGATRAIAVNAWLGSDCGVNPAGLLGENPSIWWRYPGCIEEWQAQVPCEEGTKGYFYYRSQFQDPENQWRSGCCPTGQYGVVMYEHGPTGQEIDWFIACKIGIP